LPCRSVAGFQLSTEVRFVLARTFKPPATLAARPQRMRSTSDLRPDRLALKSVITGLQVEEAGGFTAATFHSVRRRQVLFNSPLSWCGPSARALTRCPPRLVPTPCPNESAEVREPTTHKIQHPHRGFSALRVLLDQRMPLAAVGATKFVASGQTLSHRALSCRPMWTGEVTLTCHRDQALDAAG
jgi:hypothetical protein